VGAGVDGIQYFCDVTNCQICDNMIRDSADHGIHVWANNINCTDNRISGDHVINATNYGLLIDEAVVGSKFIGNTVDGCGDGVEFTSAS